MALQPGERVYFHPAPRRRTIAIPRAIGRYARTSPLGAVAFTIVSLLVLIALFAPQIAPYDPDALHRLDRLREPSARYWFGTDTAGRDQFSRVLYGTRISLSVGIMPILLSTAAGTLLGTVSGYAGGIVDATIQRAADALMAIPALVVALTVVALLGPSLRNVIIAIAVVTVPVINRIARAATLQTASLAYISAAQSLGASHARIIVRHILPNIAGPIVVIGASLVGGAILAEAGLSFLGYGVRPPAPTWGNMVGGENRAVFDVAPWLVLFPGIAITVAVLAFNIVGDSVRDWLDPRARRRN